MGIGLYMYDVVVKRSRSLSHLLMSSCISLLTVYLCGLNVYTASPSVATACTVCSASDGRYVQHAM